MVLCVVIAFICIMAGMKVFMEEEQNKIFNKRNLSLKDVKAYTHACGILIWGFGAAAVVTCYFCITSEGLLANLLPLYIMIEAVVLMKIYFEIEKKNIKND